MGDVCRFIWGLYSPVLSHVAFVWRFGFRLSVQWAAVYAGGRRWLLVEWRVLSVWPRAVIYKHDKPFLLSRSCCRILPCEACCGLVASLYQQRSTQSRRSIQGRPLDTPMEKAIGQKVRTSSWDISALPLSGIHGQGKGRAATEPLQPCDEARQLHTVRRRSAADQPWG